MMIIRTEEIRNANNVKVGETVFGRPVTKVTDKCIFIYPSTPFSKSRFTKDVVQKYFDKGNIK